MPEDKRTDDVERFLSEQKSMEDRKQALIADLLKQREASMMAFDEKLAKLGWKGAGQGGRRSHHKKSAGKATADGSSNAGKEKTRA